MSPCSSPVTSGKAGAHDQTCLSKHRSPRCGPHFAGGILMNRLFGTATATHLEMRFSPNLELVSVVRRFVADLSKRALVGAADVDRIAMATHELLENAV